MCNILHYSIICPFSSVSFYKRAQILVADLHFCATTTSVPDAPVTSCIFDGIHELTMFADYRVPQVLKYFGILEYSPELMQALEKRKSLIL